MAYDLELAQRVRDLVAGEPGLREMKMFGGLAFLVHGNMAVGATSRRGLMVRVDPGDTGSLLDEPLVRRFEMHGRSMNGWLDVDGAAVAAEDDLQRWVHRGLAYARTLPPK